jgi:hypothetical protein
MGGTEGMLRPTLTAGEAVVSKISGDLRVAFLRRGLGRKRATAVEKKSKMIIFSRRQDFAAQT